MSPVRANPVCGNPVRADPVRADPVRANPVRANPARFQHPAFTLIELMVVIFIIGILIGIVITVIPKVKRAVYGAETQAQLATLTNAIEQYHNDYKAYPGPMANNQLGTGTFGNTTAIPTISTPSGVFQLTENSTLPTGFASANWPNNMASYGYAHISGSQNLTLGLLGGLEISYTNGVPTFVYNAQDIFSDGVTPAPRGPKSLNASLPRKQDPYIQVKPGDLSTPNMSYNGGKGASFADSAQRSPSDAMIPVFLDKYSEPLPILYMRTNAGATAVVGIGSCLTTTDMNGPMFDDSGLLKDTTSGVSVIAQYDLRQVFDYTLNPNNNASGSGSLIGTAATSTKNGYPMNHHGLQGVGSLTTYTIDTDVPAASNNGWETGGGAGKNGAAYLRDPNFRIDTTNSNNNYDTTATNTHNGVARQKDGYILISAGPDRLYGTSDDVINPGPLLPAQ